MSRGEGRLGSAKPALLRRDPSGSLSRVTRRGREERRHHRNALARVEGEQAAHRLLGTANRVLKFTFAME